MNRLYSGIFFPSRKLHITYDFFRDDPQLPPGVVEGQEQVVVPSGIILNDMLGVLSFDLIRIGPDPINDEVIRHQFPRLESWQTPIEDRDDDDDSYKTPLHMTLYTATGVNPVETGRWLEDHPDQVQVFESSGYPRAMTGVWGFNDERYFPKKGMYDHIFSNGPGGLLEYPMGGPYVASREMMMEMEDNNED